MYTTKHRFQSTKGDSPNSTFVRPSAWNDDHDMETDTTNGMVLGRDTSGSGPIQELPIAVDPDGSVTLTGASFTLPSGPSSARPGAPQPGAIRYNTDTGNVEVFIAGSWQPFLVGAGMPVGTVLAYAGATVPAGFLPCTGGVYNIASYPNLAPILGTTFGGNGTTTFAVPDLIGRVIAGADYMFGSAVQRLNAGLAGGFGGGVGFAAAAGEAGHTQTWNEMPYHVHGAQNQVYTAGSNFGSGSWSINSQYGTTDGAGGGAPANNVQPTMMLNYIIKF